MIVQFKCANHRSIKDEVKFSLVASSDDSLEENLIGNKYLRCAEIYGANGSGKTSLLNAIQLMAFVVVSSNTYQLGDLLPRHPHKLSEASAATSFSIIFIKNSTKYSYGFSYTEKEIIDEYLYFWPGRKKTLLFERSSNSEFEFGSGYVKKGANCKGRLKDNKLLLSCAANETDIDEVAQAFLFFKEDLVIYRGGNNWFEYSVTQLRDNSGMKKSFIDFMRSIGTGLLDVEPKIEERHLSSKEIETLTSQGLAIPAGTPAFRKIIDLKLDYGNFFIDINEESAGIKELFKFLCPLIDILQSGKVFVCDEIENHFHPSIVAEIVKRFCSNAKSNSQMILTTHDTDLLNLDFIRRDQIWFTELKPESRSTDLYSLSELKNVRKTENIKKGYISGRYGAIPMLTNSLAEVSDAQN